MCQQIQTNHIIIIIILTPCGMVFNAQYYSERRHAPCVMINMIHTHTHTQNIIFYSDTNKILTYESLAPDENKNHN